MDGAWGLGPISALRVAGPTRPVALILRRQYLPFMRKIGLYGPVISPLCFALAEGLGISDHHGASLVARICVIVSFVGLAFAAFIGIRRKAKRTSAPSSLARNLR